MSRCWHLLMFSIGFSNVFAKNAIENVDIKNPIIFKPKLAKDFDSFGHGLSIQKNVAVIGAPKADTHGQIFKCEFDGTTKTGDVTCNKGPGIISQQIIQEPLKSPEKFENAILGRIFQIPAIE